MPNNDLLRHQMLEVAVGGKTVEKRAAGFRLATQRGARSAIARLVYPADAGVGAVDDEITVSLTEGDKTGLYFTGTVYSVNVRGARRELLLTDSYKKLCDTGYTCAYRKEKAATILDDILGAAEISKKSVTCPGIEMARFSTQKIKARQCIDLLFDALASHNERGLVYFFDEKDVLHFGTAEDTGKNEGDIFEFETSKNILRSGSGRIEVLPCPVRHTQKVKVDGRELVTVRTELYASQRLSRLTLWLREVNAAG
jgi:hypothetical protein